MIQRYKIIMEGQWEPRLDDQLKKGWGSLHKIDEGAEFVKYKDYAELAMQLIALRKEREAAVPVAYVAHYESGALHGVCEKDDPVKMEWLKRGFTITPLYAAPPAQPVAVPDEAKGKIDPDAPDYSDGYRVGWNACSAAMLKEAK